MELNRVTHDQEEIPRGTPSDIELVPSSSEDSVRLTVYNDDDEDDNEIRFDTPFLASSLAWQSVPSHNAADAPLPLSRAEMKRLILRTMTTTSLILMASMALLALILYLALPTFSEEEQAALRIPRSLEQLKSLLQIFGKYSQDHYYRVMLAWISVFLFIQTFSIPGAMYLAMLAGALWGTPVALPLVCIGIATGASSCYLLSKHVGGIVRVLPRWQHRIDSWKSTIQQYQNDLFSNEDHDDEEQPGDNSVIEWQHALEDREMQPASALRFTDDDIEALEDYEEDGLYRPTPSARREDILAYANKTSHFAEET
ncbi:hypothetical protein Malapachy_1240 [Malassezia pachydermatis]|uniref:Golgi apparatus membrane protein TVP38 n=1 Tax=Malassezia pachydermatis TaxID=77020 RepID=A0A0M9VQ25_9BASI|nr:hypothetical protein Malapachy_1240 [Malassezia pachydermatis]KOS15049.1 hypothetical protein Malapachy_1240 [Malassezia pachydermatis]